LLIARHALLVSGAFSKQLGAEAVATALARGLRAGGAPPPDVALFERDERDERDERAAIGQQLAQLRFDERMLASRAVIIAVAALDPSALALGAAHEIATRARQAGVPAYAVTGENRLSSFDERVLDLQLVLHARTTRALASAGERLSEVL
jgi:hypothetical protein